MNKIANLSEAFGTLLKDEKKSDGAFHCLPFETILNFSKKKTKTRFCCHLP